MYNFWRCRPTSKFQKSLHRRNSMSAIYFRFKKTSTACGYRQIKTFLFFLLMYRVFKGWNPLSPGPVILRLSRQIGFYYLSLTAFSFYVFLALGMRENHGSSPTRTVPHWINSPFFLPKHPKTDPIFTNRKTC